MKNQLPSRQSDAGFTLIELLVVIIMVGILSAIAIPGWLGFVNRQRINTSQNTALTLLRDAQAKAKQQRVSWQACFWDDGNQVLASIQPVISSNECQSTNGKSLIADNSKAITFTSTFTQNPPNYYRVQFKYDGSVNGVGELGKITFIPRNSSGTKACIFVSTLLGAMRTDKDSGCN
ncbi:type II secretion system protein [Nostoc sp. FACHB-888]|uniref:type II secretion system protein n=1 Tax=Nostoc sp. FACHB-888 TaxID=2692842 RepID=UPI00168447E1|nr:type II secretion system protein [Nostoc sp. FACHB-888]MBD2242607.1 type II secretion system protein [Nostoc sp. FACHB-888]